jgi:hypothetical protein
MSHIPWIDFYLKLLWKLREIRYSKIIMKVVFKKTKKGKKNQFIDIFLSMKRVIYLAQLNMKFFYW